MQTSRSLSRAFLALAAMLLLTSAGLAADPGLRYPNESEASDQKAGSVLIYNIYSSAAPNPASQNTRFNITNTSSTSGAFVHLFFVEGGTCSVADRYICLTALQTMTFLASEQDPSTTGYLLAIAVDGVYGCPINFNFLIGDEYVKFETGHFANLGAEAIAAVSETPAGRCGPDSTEATIAFDGVSYNLVPRVLALSNIGSPGDGNVVRIWINRIGGNLFGGGGGTGTFFGILYDDAETPQSFTLSSANCQRGFTLSDNNPRTTPRFSVVIPAGQTGWFKIWSTSNVGLFGVAINFNAGVANGAGAFNGGHNLHKLRLTSDAYVMPIFNPAC